MTFAELRRKAGFNTQEALAEELGVSRTTIAKWETGERTFRLSMLEKLMAVLDCGSEEICNAALATRQSAKKDNKGA